LEAEWQHVAALLAAAGSPLAAGNAALAVERAAEVVAVAFLAGVARRPERCSLTELAHLVPVAQLARHFFEADVDGSGSLSVSELAAAAAAVRAGSSRSSSSTHGALSNGAGAAAMPLESLDVATIAELLAQMDRDLDGRVDLAEFVHFFR
jgi:Ca2+-binding EF-hand superfamily protein